jgi:hypothetical protein
MTMTIYSAGELQESGLILLNWQEVGNMEYALSKFGQIRATTAGRFRANLPSPLQGERAGTMYPWSG